MEACGAGGLGEELGHGRGTSGLRVTAMGLCGVSEGCSPITAVGRRTRALAGGAIRPSAGCPQSPFSQGCFAVASSLGSLSFTRLRRVFELDGKHGRRPWSSEHSHWAVLVLRLRPALLCHGVVGPPGSPASVLLLQVRK